ncbi:hypothetical protein KVP97_09135 [Escherichia coli]|nr:hypothetical protein [Escherichia sp. MOD1-EC7003]MCH0694005.1 hypothetical protein [Escherichia coli]
MVLNVVLAGDFDYVRRP